MEEDESYNLNDLFPIVTNLFSSRKNDFLVKKMRMGRYGFIVLDR